MNDQVASDSNKPTAPLPLAPAETNIDNLPSLEDEYALGAGLLERGVRLPKPLVWGVLVVVGLAVIVAAVWGYTQSTITYGVAPVDAATTARLAQIRDKLSAAGAPKEALRYLDMAAQPGLNVGDAIEALINADKALGALSDKAGVASARQELRIILAELDTKRYGEGRPPVMTATPLPTLMISP